MDSVVLSYHDSLLRECDVALLDGSNWLNDKIIGFYFEYLEYDVFRQYKEQVCFITPDVTQFIKLYDGQELGMFLEPLCLHQREVVILAVNNNSSSVHAGGSHWSTLVYVRAENTFHHLDSCGGSNSLPAKQCAKKVTPFLKVSTQPEICQVVHCPQQENMYDCGVYALCFAEAMCAVKLKEGDSGDGLGRIDSQYVRDWRTNTKKLISSLR